MPGLQIRLPLSLTEAQPVVRADPMLSAGSLLLVEPGNPGAPFAGVPTDGTLLPNIAAASARAVLGAGELRPRWTAGAAQAPANLLLERSSKGGLHGIVSKTNTGTGKGAHLAMPQPLLAHIWANPGHAFYYSVWGRTTRVGGGTSDSSTPFLAGVVGIESPTALTAAAIRARLTRPSAGTQGAVGARPGYSVTEQLGPVLRTLAAPVYVGTTAENTGLTGAAAIFGAVGILPGSPDFTHMPSWVHYRTYVEDLTLSGRSYAEVDALDAALFAAEVTTAGGRYQGDTYTSPDVLP